MVNQTCSHPGCDYDTGEIADVNLLIEVLKIHALSHTHATPPPTPASTNAGTARQKAPKIERPKISCGSSEETWNAFTARWTMFKRGTELTADEIVQQLFQCCDEHLGNSILRTRPDITEQDEATLMALIKTLAVIPVARVVRRTDLLASKQDHGESTRSYLARIKGKALTCGYKKPCGTGTCAAEVDFTDVLVKDVVIGALVDEEIKKDILGWAEVDVKTVEESLLSRRRRWLLTLYLDLHHWRPTQCLRTRPRRRNLQTSPGKRRNARSAQRKWTKLCGTKGRDVTLNLPCASTVGGKPIPGNKKQTAKIQSLTMLMKQVP